MQNFTTFKLQKLQDTEIRKASKRIVAVVSQQDAEVYHLTGMQKLLLEAVVSMQLKQVFNRKLTETPDVLHAKSEISRIMGTILSLVKAYRRGNVPAQVAHLDVIQPYVDLYTSSILAAKASADEPQLDDFFLAISNDAKVEVAIEGLQLKELFAGLLLNHNALSDSVGSRSKSVSTRKDNNFRALRMNTSKAIRNFMLAIELAIVEYPELDYSKIVSNINVIIIEFNALVDARSTRKGNKGTAADTTAAA